MGQSVCVGCVCGGGGVEWVCLCVLVVFVGGDRMGQSLCVGCVFRG